MDLLSKGIFKSKNLTLNTETNLTNENVILGIRPENLLLKSDGEFKN